MLWNPAPEANQEELAEFVCQGVEALSDALADSHPEIVTEASETLARLEGDRSFDGYQSERRDRVINQIWSVYAALQTRAQVVYSGGDQNYSISEQAVRAPVDVLSDKHANCIEAACFVSAWLVRIGLNPLLLIVRRRGQSAASHALVAVWLKDVHYESTVADSQAVDRVSKGLYCVDVVGALEGPGRTRFQNASGIAREWLSAAGWNVEYAIDLRAWLDGVKLPVLAISGAKGGVGKTTIVGRVAEMIAETGTNVLVVDLDIEHAGMTQLARSRSRGQPPNIKTTYDHLVGQVRLLRWKS